jgi:hypothetical protein
VGETQQQTLGKRWYQFDCSVNGRPGHSGGFSFREHLSEHYSLLHVAPLPVPHLPAPMRSIFIATAERTLLWEWARRHGMLPICNRK